MNFNIVFLNYVGFNYKNVNHGICVKISCNFHVWTIGLQLRFSSKLFLKMAGNHDFTFVIKRRGIREKYVDIKG